MINLLPPLEKRNLLKEFRLRFSIAALWVVLMLEVFLFALLVPSYLEINHTVANLEADLAAKKSSALPEGDNVQKRITTLKSEIALLKPTETKADIPPTKLMSDILSKKPSGVSISSYAYGRSGQSVIISISGNGATREDLLLFQRLLKEDERFTDAKYAQSFITRKTNIDFTLTVNIK